MDDEQMKLDAVDDKLINDAFERLINDYLNSRHRKNSTLPVRLIRVCAVCLANLISCTPLLWLRLFALR